MLLLLTTLAWACETEVTTCSRPDGPPSAQPCEPDLQRAIDQACDDGIVNLGGGTYRDSVEILDRRKLTVRTIAGAPNVRFEDAPDAVLGQPGTFRIERSVVVLRDLHVVLRNQRFLLASDAIVTLDEVSLQNMYNGSKDSLIDVENTVLELIKSDILGGGGGWDPAQVSLEGRSSLLVEDSRLEGINGSAIRTMMSEDHSPDVSLVRATIEQVRSERGAIFGGSAKTGVQGGRLSVRDSVFRSNRGPQIAATSYEPVGAAFHWYNDVYIEDSVFEDNSSGDAHAIDWGGGGSFTMVRSTICRSGGEGDHTVYLRNVSPDKGARVYIANSRFLGNQGGIRVNLQEAGDPVDLPVKILHNHFVGNLGSSRGVLAAPDDPAAVLFAHNVLYDNADILPAPGPGPSIVEPGVTAVGNLWFDNRPGRDPRLVDAEAVVVDPLIGVLDGPCDHTPAGLTVGRPDYYGGTVDMGHSDIGFGVPPRMDLDGSAPDLGAWGGQQTWQSEWTDDDHDGVPFLYDCDPTDPTIGAGLPETPDDGVDSDCDGLDDSDRDRDGFGFTTDCDDLDPARAPDHAEIPLNGIDDDCDGIIDESLPVEPAGCVAAPSDPWPWGLAVVLVAIWRRRANGDRPGCGRG